MISPSHSAPVLVEMSAIGKRFGSVGVLDNIGFELRAGEVHVLAGENGAGKSTLIKILAGVHQEFDGELRIHGKASRPRSPLHATQLGVAVIHQEMSLIPSMTVADNLFLGRLPSHFGVVDRRRQFADTRKWLDRLGLNIDPGQAIESLSIATQQLIEIAKALSLNARIIVMDEPTSALNVSETERLFDLIVNLKRDGCGIIYISHKMYEIQQLADRITILRNGKSVATAAAADLPTSKLIRLMVGREVEPAMRRSFDAKPIGKSQPNRFAIRNFSVYPQGKSQAAAVNQASLTVRSGEVVGLGGLQGSGISQLFGGIFGAYGGNVTGERTLNGRQIAPANPRQATRQGLALLTNDRKRSGLVMSQSVISNTTLASLEQHCRLGWLIKSSEYNAARRTRDAMSLHSASLDQEVSLLSGGNQQKVAIGKWLETQPDLLMLDEPTRGIDVGAKQQIYELIEQWKSEGLSILLSTSEIPELMLLSDRIYVMHSGSVSAEFNRDTASPEKIMEAAMGARQ